MSKLKLENSFVVLIAIYFGLGYAIGKYGAIADDTATSAPDTEPTEAAQARPVAVTPPAQTPSTPPVPAPAPPAPAPAPSPPAALAANPSPPAATATAPNKAQPNPEQVWKVRISDQDAVVGPKQALVTCALFSAFGCSTCASMSDTPTRLAKEFKNDVRVLFKHKVIPPSHPESLEASMAAMAAQKQGKFWAYHDKLFAAGSALDRDSLVRYARELKLNVGRFTKVLDSAELRARALGDTLQANEVAAHSMPNLLCNGVRMSGPKTYDNAKKLVAKELAKAKKKQAAGAKIAGLYQAITESGKSFPQLGTSKFNFQTANSPSLGPKTAKIEVVIFEDFQ